MGSVGSAISKAVSKVTPWNDKSVNKAIGKVTPWNDKSLEKHTGLTPSALALLAAGGIAAYQTGVFGLGGSAAQSASPAWGSSAVYGYTSPTTSVGLFSGGGLGGTLSSVGKWIGDHQMLAGMLGAGTISGLGNYLSAKQMADVQKDQLDWQKQKFAMEHSYGGSFGLNSTPESVAQIVDYKVNTDPDYAKGYFTMARKFIPNADDLFRQYITNNDILSYEVK